MLHKLHVNHMKNIEINYSALCCYNTKSARILPTNLFNKLPINKRLNLIKTVGFSLIELMIVVAIIGIIVGFGTSSWKESTLKSKRKEAQATLLTGSQYMERFYSARNSYTTVGTISPTPFNGISNPNYTFSFSSTASTYTLTATPTQTDDKCGNLTLNHAGVKTESGSKDVRYCW